MKENEKPYWIYLFRSQKKKTECQNCTHQLEMSKFQPKLRKVQPQFRSFLRILLNFSQFWLKFWHFQLLSGIFTFNFFPVLKKYKERHNHFTQVNAVLSFFCRSIQKYNKIRNNELLLCFTWTNSIQFFPDKFGFEQQVVREGLF